MAGGLRAVKGLRCVSPGSTPLRTPQGRASTLSLRWTGADTGS